MASADDSDDPVVREVDVFAASRLASTLCLLQFPLRPAWRDMRAGELLEARIKTLQRAGPRLELDACVPRSDRYDGASRWQMGRQTLRSAPAPLQTNYCVGIVRSAADARAPRDQLHVTPFSAAMQMRPSFAYIDEADAASKRAEAASDAAALAAATGTAAATVQQADATGATGATATVAERAVQVQYRRREQQPKSMTARRHMAAAAAAREEAETKWQALRVVEADDRLQAQAMFDQLLCQNASTARVPFDVPPARYLDALAPLPGVEDYVERQRRSMQRAGLSLEQLARFEPERKVREAMVAAGALPYAKVAELCTGFASETELLASLSQCAVLVDGRWVVRSDVVHPGTSGLRHVRDYVLLLFNRAQPFTRGQIVEATGVDGERLTAMLSHIARRVSKPLPHWELRIPRDTEFCQAHPDVALSGNAFWETHARGIMRAVHQLKSGLIRLEGAGGGGGGGGGGAGAMGLGSAADVMDLGEIARTQKPLMDFLHELFRDNGVCNIAFLKGRIANKVFDSSPGNPLHNATVPDELLMAVLRTFAEPLHDVWVRKEYPDSNPDITAVRTVLLGMFRANKVLRKTDVKTECQRQIFSAPSATGGKKHFPSEALRTVTNELAVASGNAWSLKPGTGDV